MCVLIMLAGPMIRLDVLGQTIIILDNAEDVKQLFWTRSSNYSNRMSMYMVGLCVPVVASKRSSLSRTYILCA